jgi:type I restriction enzyme S subunit
MKLESLGNIAKIIAGQSPPSSEYNKNGDGIPFFQGKADFGHTNPVARSWTTKTTKLSVPDDILISVRAPVGSVNINNIDACIGRGLSAIRVNKNISRDYIYQYLKVNEKRISKMGVGSTFTAINQKDLASIKIPIPENLADQIRIGEVLTTVETLILQRKESIDLLDDFLRTTFLDMFIYNPETKKWDFTEVKNTVEKAKNAIKAGPFGSSLKKEFYVEKGYKIYGQEQVIKDDLNYGNYYINEELYKKLESCKIKEGDVLISLVGTYGKIIIVPKEFELGIINPRLMKVSFDKKVINPVYFKFFFKSEYLLRQLSKLSRGGTMDIINVGIVKEIKISIPPIKLQNKFASIVEKAEKVKVQYKESLIELENLFGSLSQKAFKGELDLRKLDVSAQIREIEKKIEAESGLDISLETKLTKPMQQFIKQTTELQKRLALADKMVPKSLYKQIETINKLAAPLQAYKAFQIPEALSQAMKSFDGIKSITSQLNQEAKEKFTTKLTWEEVNFEMVANWIKEEYSEYHFNSEILMNFLENERVTFSNYHSSEELKTNPKLNEEDDIKSFVFSALKGKNQFIKLEQFFYDAVSENVQLKLRSEDYEVIKDKEKELRSGIYFKVVE